MSKAMLRSQQGFTMVEMLAVVVIFLLLMFSISTVFMASLRLYHAGMQQAGLHSDLRLAAEKIIRELRFAYYLELLDESVWDIDAIDTSEYRYIYLDRETNTIIQLDETGSHPLSNEVIAGVSFVGNVSTLLFTLHGESGGQSYSLDSSVRLLNYRCNFHNPDNPIALRYSLDPNFVPES
ncbi:MAG: prepilin-type N-terminal cleavage/methylation domain-containing protein [Firmicutes bacterium]|nr:prepilin-type N-terminal cleavage/methylation domain-containing protein [Bacillota bacterium]HOB35196.1 prepilin-type N-terminal cleavage/methylation domain-containing protein [Bacillota bacterium]HPZ90290.1 prepilin-type N-terminal cleavage/methylation domain-containing protein [Bacillota bacterium]HQE01795.1 prepilin-type N-terminal cleavage/methylation domain-containing protein [Bacillota bacterium]